MRPEEPDVALDSRPATPGKIHHIFSILTLTPLSGVQEPYYKWLCIPSR